MQREETEADAGLAISSEKAFYIIAKAREFDEKVAPSDPDSGSNPSDDRDVDILEDYRNDPTLEELEGALRGLNEDEQLDIIALMWLGRGDFGSFDEARAEASAMSDKHIPRYLIGTPMLADYLEEGLTQVGVSLEEFEINRM